MNFEIIIADHVLTIDDIKANRENIIILRNSALQNGEMEWTIVLSNTIVLLEALIRIEETAH